MIDPPSAPRDERTATSLYRLLAATQVLVTERSLPALLQRIVTTAREVVDAQYAALAVVNADGRLEQFVHVGLDESTMETIGDLATDSGLLGALRDEPRPVRLRSAADDPNFTGEATDQPLGPLLVVPIRSNTAVYGNLYLVNPVDGAEFDAADETAVLALAASAGVAVENARLHEQAARRQDWLRAAAEVGQRLLLSEGSDDVFELIAGSVLRLAPADTVTLVVAVPERPHLLEVVAAAGAASEQLRWRRYPMVESLVGRVMGDRRGLLVDTVKRQDLSPWVSSIVPVQQVMVVALRGEGPPLGALVAGRVEPDPFTSADLEMTEVFAEQATLALERTAARSDRHRLELLEDRCRIARDLHDHIIQRLFAAGLTLQAVSTSVRNHALRDQLAGIIAELNATIRRIRDFIAELQAIEVRDWSARLAVMATVTEAAPLLGLTPAVAFRGPLDSVVDDDTAAEVGIVLRERLLFLARIGGVEAVKVEVSVEADHLVLIVDDDGAPPSGAEASGGEASSGEQGGGSRASLSLGRSPLGGGQLRWSMPLVA